MQLICDAFLKEIRSLEGESNHKVVDVWLLLIIHANGGPYRKLAEGLLKRKVVHGDFNTALIQKCLCGRGESLQVNNETYLSRYLFLWKLLASACGLCYSTKSWSPDVKVSAVLLQDFAVSKWIIVENQWSGDTWFWHPRLHPFVWGVCQQFPSAGGMIQVVQCGWFH